MGRKQALYSRMRTINGVRVTIPKDAGFTVDELITYVKQFERANPADPRWDFSGLGIPAVCEAARALGITY